MINLRDSVLGYRPRGFSHFAPRFPPRQSVHPTVLTLAGLGLGDPLSDDPAGIVDGRGRLELHGLHHVALANADFQRQHHHLGRLCANLPRGGEFITQQGLVFFLI